MPMKASGFDELVTEVRAMADAADLDGAGAALGRRALKAAAQPVFEQMKINASVDPKIISGTIFRSIKVGSIKKHKIGGQRITVGVHRKEERAYYATPVEYGHGGPAPAPAHPFIRPAFDTQSEAAYQEMRRILQKEIKP